jgi:hypothetical protein
VDTPGLTKWARGSALILATLVTFLWTINALIGFFTPDSSGHWSLIYALFYTVIWILVVGGLLKMRRGAAIGGFVLSVIALIWGIRESNFFISIVMTWMFINAREPSLTNASLDLKSTPPLVATTIAEQLI